MNKIAIGFAMTILAFVFLIAYPNAQAADIPPKISYQGKLLENGMPANGTKTMAFSIGSWNDTLDVSVVDGLYSVTLGSAENPIPADVFDNPDVTLQISVESVPLPQTAILSTPFSFVSEKSGDADKLGGQAPGYYLEWDNLNNVSETDPVWSAEKSAFANLSDEQTFSGTKSFSADTYFTGDVYFGNDSDPSYLTIYSIEESLAFAKVGGTMYGEIGTNENNDMIFNNPASGGEFRFSDDLYLRYTDASNWRDLYCGEIYAHDYVKFYSDDETRVATIIPQPNGGITISGGYVEIRDGLIVKKEEEDYMQLGNYLRLSEGDHSYYDLAVHTGEDAGEFKIYGNIEVTGSAVKPGGGSWSSSSDIRLKDVEGDFQRGLEALNRLKPVYFRYKKDNALGLPSDKRFVGLVAQETRKAVPEAVEEDASGYLTIDNDPVVWTILNAVKELDAENRRLKSRLEELEKRLALEKDRP